MIVFIVSQPCDATSLDAIGLSLFPSEEKAMAKVKHYEDNLSPASTFGGKHITDITTKNGDKFSGRGTTKEKSREAAEEKYDTDRRGE
jgi:hypothetical protein